MKKGSIAAFCLCLGLALTACKKEKEIEDPIVYPAEITRFEVPLASGSVTARIDGLGISVFVPYGTNTKTLKPNVSANSEATVSPNSGETVDLSRPRIYKVTNNTTVVEYVVTVVVLPEEPNAP